MGRVEASRLNEYWSAHFIERKLETKTNPKDSSLTNSSHHAVLAASEP